MEGHSLIYVIAALLYLYFIARVIDRFKRLIKARHKIKKPVDKKQTSIDKWMQEVRASQRQMKNLFTYSVLLILIIPVLEVSAHLIVGNYFENGQLLTLIFVLLFETILVITILIMKSRGQIDFKRKVDWDSVSREFNSRSKLL